MLSATVFSANNKYSKLLLCSDNAAAAATCFSVVNAVSEMPRCNCSITSASFKRERYIAGVMPATQFTFEKARIKNFYRLD
ncbi:MAG: hypothetical protein R3E67_01750 [Pseudomonadales bacterium]